MKTKMKYIIKLFPLALIMLCLPSISFSQGDVNLSISETSINQAIQALLDSKAINFGKYDGSYGVSQYNINITGASINLIGNTQNNAQLNISLSARATFNLVAFSFDVNVNPSFTLVGNVILNSQGQGYKLILNPQSITNFSATGTFLDNLVQDYVNGFIKQIPEITFASYSSLLPSIATQYFTSGTPALTVTDDAAILSLTLLGGPRFITAQNDVNQEVNKGSVQDEEGVNNFVSYDSPKTFSFSSGSTQKLQTPTALLDNSTGGKNKYKNWFKTSDNSVQTDIATRRIQLTVGTSDETYKARFDPAQHVQLYNSLDGVSGGTITYDSYSGIAYDDYDFSYNSNPVQHPVTTSSPNDGTVWSFLGWNDGYGSQSRSVTLNSDINYTAKYKGKLRTGRPDLGNTQNQRRLIATSDNATWIMVYESLGNVYLTSSADGGVNWINNEVKLNVQDGAASNPSISNLLYYNGYRPCYLISWVETVGGTSTLHFQSLQLYGGIYWGWQYYPANGQNSDNHKTLNQIPMGQGGGTTSWPLRSDARPVVYLTQNGSAIKTYIAYEGSDGLLRSGFMTTPVIDNDLSGTYLDRVGFDPYIRNSSLYTSYNPVIITYPSTYGYPAKTYMYFLSGGYASGRRVAVYDFDAKTESVLQNPNNDYTYYSLQGAVSPGNGTYCLVAEALQPGTGYHISNLYYHPTYYGSSIPGPSVVATNMSQPTVMFDQSSGFGTSFSGSIVMKSGSDNNFYQYTGTLSQINTNANVAGVFAKGQVSNGDRSTMLVKTSSSPAILVKYGGSGLAKSEGNIPMNIHIVRIIGNKNGEQKRISLDISNTNVEVIDSLEQGDDVCVLKVRHWGSSRIQQIDSLIAPLAVSIKRNGKKHRSFNASLWKSISSENIPDIQDGDIMVFSLHGMNKIAGFTTISLAGNSLPKQSNDAESLIPTKQDISLFPNPFNPSTTFRISLPEAKHVQLIIYNMLGQQVATVVDNFMQAGYNEIRFNGSSLASGMYLYRMQIENELRSGKMMLMK